MAGNSLVEPSASSSPVPEDVEMHPQPENVADENSLKVGIQLQKIRNSLQEKDSHKQIKPRAVLFKLISKVAALADLFEDFEIHEDQCLEDTKYGLLLSAEKKIDISAAMTDVIRFLIHLSDSVGIDLGRAALRKMEKNRIKYPATLAHGSSAKYTAYTKEGAVSVEYSEDDYTVPLEREWTPIEFRDIVLIMREFARERNWNQYHRPRNLVLALTGELGELCECFQWKGEVERGLADWPIQDKVHLGEELSDCLLYTARLSDQCFLNVDEQIVAFLA